MKHRLLLPAFLGMSVLWAHPMGKFSVSHYSRIEVTPRGADIRYVLDLGEIPALQLLEHWKLQATSLREEMARHVTEQAREWTHNLRIEAGGRAVAPNFLRATMEMNRGFGGMPTMRITTEMNVTAAPGSLQFEDSNYADRSGWKEIVTVAGNDAVIDRAIPNSPDRSQALTAYPADAALTPPQDLHAFVEWHATVPGDTGAGSAGAATQPGQEGTGIGVRGDFLSRLLHQGEISWGMMLVGMLVAFGLGSVHALSPGHGKTIVAAYLVGSRGTPKHALFLGGMVTFTHTISVFGLGLTMLFLSQYVLPGKIITVLGAISGLSIVWIGATLLYRRSRAALGKSPTPHHHHDHDHSHSHSHDGLVHDHGDGHVHSHVPEGDVTMGSLIALGASGGLVPCPSALVLLLSAQALGRIGLGLLLLMAFSAGLAVVLSAIGLIVLYAKHLLPDSKKATDSLAFRYLPVASAAFIVCAGIVITGVAVGVIRPFAGV